MTDDFDRSVGGIIAGAMQYTFVAFVIAILALVSASFLFGFAHAIADGPSNIRQIYFDDILGTAMLVLFLGIPWAFMLVWGIPIALFQMYCFYAIIYEDGNRLQRVSWLFLSQLVAAPICVANMDSERSTAIKAFLLALSMVGLPYGLLQWTRNRKYLQGNNRGGSHVRQR